ncbi:MAG: helix-turn-helix domain-containing protein [Bacteriovoracia bacterium]
MANPLTTVQSAEKPERALAKNLAHLRAARGLTQQTLAQLAGIPRSTVTHIESGVGNPSLANLWRLAAALQVSIEELLARPRPRVKHVRREEVPRIKRAQGAVWISKLLPDPVPGMEMDRMEIEPGGRMGGVPHLAGTKEYLTCASGEVVLRVAGDSYRLKPGDVVAFPGDQAHAYENPGRSLAVCFSVVALAPRV